MTNEQLKRYLALTNKIQKLSKEKSELREMMLEEGSGSTKDYVFTVESFKKERLAGKKEFAEQFGLENLYSWGLVKTYYSKEVNVSEKKEEISNAG